MSEPETPAEGLAEETAGTVGGGQAPPWPSAGPSAAQHEPAGQGGGYGGYGWSGPWSYGEASPVAAYGQAGAEGPSYPPGPYDEVGPPPELTGQHSLTAHPHARALRSAAAVLVVAAAAVTGAGLSRVIWPATQPARAAAPSTTLPSGSAGNQSPFSGNNPAGGSPFGGFPGNSGGNQSTEGPGGPSDVSAIASKVDPALVDVNVIFNYNSAEGAGTGIVLSSNGLVLTNNHVIDEATKVSVTDVGNGKTYPATVLGYDNTHDVALLQLQGASGLTAAHIASGQPSVGEAVVAIGNAGGTGGTPTSAGGSITALDQSINASDQLTNSSEELSGLIEVNANVESGDSGGPLVDASGAVIGMDTAASQSFAFSAQGNQGFAIPISQALQLAREIEAGKGSATVHVGPTAFLGLEFLPPGTSQSPFGQGPSGYPYGSTPPTSSPAASGPQVYYVVPGTPAYNAGIGQGDTITTFGGQRVGTDSALTHMLVTYHPGQKVAVTWVTPTGQSRSATVTLGSGPPS